jgi:hypothetical protein
MADLQVATREKQTEEHGVIDEALRDGGQVPLLLSSDRCKR